ncbi:hypothetical protein [Lacinutrix chionoecetis]
MIEVIGSYTLYYDKFDFLEPVYNSKFRKNYWWFTIAYDIFVVILFSIFYQKIIATPRFKTILKITTLAFTVFSIGYIIHNIDALFIQLLPVIQIGGALIILLCFVLYFIELLLHNRIMYFYKSLYFYITIGIFLWWIIITPLTFYDLYFSNADWNFIFLQWQIFLFANFIMYTTFVIGLIVSKPEQSA